MRFCIANMYSKRFLLFVFMIHIVNAESADQYKIVETTNGQVRGVRNITLLNGTPFYSFKGIPYSKPPIGDLRYKVGIRNASNWIDQEQVILKYSNIRLQSRLNHGNQLFWTRLSMATFALNMCLFAIIQQKAKTAWHWTFLFQVKSFPFWCWNSFIFVAVTIFQLTLNRTKGWRCYFSFMAVHFASVLAMISFMGPILSWKSRPF